MKIVVLSVEAGVDPRNLRTAAELVANSAIIYYRICKIAFIQHSAVYLHSVIVERGGSVVECRTRNRESPGSNPL